MQTGTTHRSSMHSTPRRPCARAACARPTIKKKNSTAEEAVALLQPKGSGTANANVVVQSTARHSYSPNNKLSGRYASGRTPTKEDIV